MVMMIMMMMMMVPRGRMWELLTVRVILRFLFDPRSRVELGS